MSWLSKVYWEQRVWEAQVKVAVAEQRLEKAKAEYTKLLSEMRGENKKGK